MKDKFVDAFQNWLPKIEIESGQSIKTFYADRGGEFISIKLKGFCDKKSIALKYGVPYIYEENGLAERSWRIIITIKDLLLWDSGLLLDFWAEAMDTTNYLQNRLPTKSQRGKLILEEAWSNKKQDVSYLKVFKSLASMEIPKEKRYKFDIQKNWYSIFIGNSFDTTEHFRIWAPKTRQLLIGTDSYINKSK